MLVAIRAGYLRSSSGASQGDGYQRQRIWRSHCDVDLTDCETARSKGGVVVRARKCGENSGSENRLSVPPYLPRFPLIPLERPPSDVHKTSTVSSGGRLIRSVSGLAQRQRGEQLFPILCDRPSGHRPLHPQTRLSFSQRMNPPLLDRTFAVPGITCQRYESSNLGET